MRKFLEEFKAFALKGNVLDLAVAVIIGAAFQAIINSVVNDLIMPLVNWIFGGIDFTNKYIVLADSDRIVTEAVLSGADVVTEAVTVGDLKSLADLEAAGVGVFKYGSFITAVINFLLMALVIFFLVKCVTRLTALGHKKAEAAVVPTTKKCPYCQTDIAISATRCPNCTSLLDESGSAVDQSKKGGK